MQRTPLHERAVTHAKWAWLEQDHDLVWDIGAITNRNEAIAFLCEFQNRFCVYSSYVQKLYSNYQFVINHDESSAAVTVLPNQFAYHDTFHGIPNEAVEPTGIHIMPADVVGMEGLVIKIPRASAWGRSRDLPFAEGLQELIRNARTEGDCFLPILLNGDLREYEDRLPSLHLHRIALDKLQRHLSSFAINDIKSVIADNLIGLYKQQRLFDYD